MKRYNVYMYNNIEKSHDCYMVIAEDPVDARNVAVQRLVDETGHGLDKCEITEVKEVYRDWETDRKSTRLNSSHITRSRMPSSA